MVVKDDTADILQEYVSNTSYLKFKDLNPIEGIYKGVVREENPNRVGTQWLVYLIEIEGEPKTLSSSSKRLAEEMLAKKVTSGDFVRITQKGSGFDIFYEVEVGKGGVPF